MGLAHLLSLYTQTLQNPSIFLDMNYASLISALIGNYVIPVKVVSETLLNEVYSLFRNCIQRIKQQLSLPLQHLNFCPIFKG